MSLVYTVMQLYCKLSWVVQAYQRAKPRSRPPASFQMQVSSKALVWIRPGPPSSLPHDTEGEQQICPSIKAPCSGEQLEGELFLADATIVYPMR